jgi:transketolase
MSSVGQLKMSTSCLSYKNDIRNEPNHATSGHQALFLTLSRIRSPALRKYTKGMAVAKHWYNTDRKLAGISHSQASWYTLTLL